MEMKLSFPGGLKVAAAYKGYTIITDQPVKAGGNGDAPSPFDLFLGSIGTCAGFYIVNFCRQRHIPTTGIEVELQFLKDEETGMITKVSIAIKLPPDFPEQYRDAIVRAADVCTVKKHIMNPPQFEIFYRRKGICK